MHIITVLTLIFLPGTFISVSQPSPYVAHAYMYHELIQGHEEQTFFSSGVLNWDDKGDLGQEWVVRQKAMGVFFAICVTMMVVTIVAWYWFSHREKKRMVVAENLLEEGLNEQ